MKTAYIFHDAFCDQFSDWYPWMKTTLESQGYLVIVPSFPTPGGQSLASWKSIIRNYVDKFDGDTILIGHGTGGAFALKLLEDISKPVRGLFLVASYAEPIGHVGYDRVNDSFVNQPFDWNKIKSNAPFIQTFAGEDDPFVPLAISQHLAELLNQALHIIPGGGHVNKASGFTQLIAVAQSIQESGGRIERSIEVDAPALEEFTPPTATAPVGLRPVEPASFEVRQDPLHYRGEGGSRREPGEDAPKAHTMYQDMSRLVNSNQGAVASSLLTKARTDETIQKEARPLSPKNILYILGTIIIALVVIAITSYLLTRNLPAQQKGTASVPASIIQSERHVKIDTTGTESYALEKKIRDGLASNTTEGITDLYYVNGTMRTSFVSVLSKLGISTVPESLSDEFLLPQAGEIPLFMHGAGTIAGSSYHFLVLPVSHYDIAFAGMKEWEPTMVRDLGIFMNMPDATIKAKTTKDTFVDQTINNRQVRIVRDAENNITLAYFFLTEKVVVIVDNTESISELLKRYANSQIYR